MKTIFHYITFFLLFSSFKTLAQTPELIFPAAHFAGSVAVTPDEKWLISGADGEVKIWEYASGRLIKNLLFGKNTDGAYGDGFTMAVSPDSKMVAIQSGDTLFFFNLDKFGFEKKVKLKDPLHCLVFSKDSKTLFASGRVKDKYDDYVLQKVAITEGVLTTLQKYVIKTQATHQIDYMSLSPDGTQLLLYDAVIGSRLWDIKSNKFIKTWEKDVFPYQFLDNGNLLGYSGEKEKTFFIEELDGKTYKSIRKTEKIFEDINDVSAQNYAVTYPSLSGKIAIEYQVEYIVFDTKTFGFSDKKRFSKPDLGMNNAHNICLSPNGKSYVHGLTMERNNLNTNVLELKYGIFPAFATVDFPLQHTDGLWLTDRILQFDKGVFRMKRFTKPAADMGCLYRLTQDGKRGFIIGNSAGLYEFDPNAKEFRYKLIEAAPREGLVGMRLFENLNLITVVSNLGVSIIDLKTLKLRHQIKMPEGGSYILFEKGASYYTDIAPDKSKLVFFADGDGENDHIYCFDLVTKSLLWHYENKWLANVRFAENGKKVQFTSQYQFTEVEAANGKPTQDEVQVSISKWDWRSYLSPSTKYAATQLPTKNDDGVGTDVEVFDLNTKKQVAILRGSESRVEGIHFLRNERYLVTEEYGGLRLWDIEKKREIAKIQLFEGSDDWMIVTPDGRFDASPEAMRKMYFTKGKTVIPLESLYEKFYVPNLLSQIWENNLPAQDIPDIKKLKLPPTLKMIYEPSKVVKDLLLEGQILETTTDKATIQITLEATAPDDVVDEIRLYHNGKLIVNKTRNLIVEDEKSGSEKKVYTIELVEGDNLLKALAINSQRTESKPDAIKITYKPAKTGSSRPTTTADITLHMLVVGIDKYKNPKYNLNYATADATGFKEAIERGGVSIFTKTNIVFISDEKATKEGISKELDKIKVLASAKDVFIFYYAGHGVLNQNKDFFLVPHDVTQLYGNDDALTQKGLSANQLQQFSKDIKAQKQLFILDACQSAGALQTVAMRGAAEEKAIAQLARATGTHWLTASGSEQFASEFSQLGHGTFTYVLLEALSGKADKGGDKKVTVKELDAYLQEVVPELTAKYKGTPQYPASYGFGNDFPIGVVKQ